MMPTTIAIFGRLAIMAALWMVLTGGQTGYWQLSVIVVVMAAFVSLRSAPPGGFRLRPVGTIRFAQYFLVYSARAGVDVAVLAFRRPGVPEAGTINFTTSLPVGVPRFFFVATIGLFPGSLGVSLEGDRVRVHVLDRSVDVEAQLRLLECRVADMFAL